MNDTLDIARQHILNARGSKVILVVEHHHYKRIIGHPDDLSIAIQYIHTLPQRRHDGLGNGQTAFLVASAECRLR